MISQLLKEAKSLIEDPQHWNEEYFARNSKGQDCRSRDPEAVAWCAWGAINKVTDSHNNDAAANFLYRSAFDLFKKKEIWEVNDCIGHTAVMQMYDRAIELAEQDEANAKSS